MIAGHPDDEVLGCGGTIARHVDQGDDVHILIMAEGATSRGSTRDAKAWREELEALKNSSRAAADILGVRPPDFAQFPDNRMDGVELLDIVKPIEATIARIEPAIVYTQHGSDLNIDHAIVNRAVVTACRPIPGVSVEALYAFETPSSTEWGAARAPRAFCPNRFVNIAPQLERKLSALRCYQSEMRPFPHARSYEAVEALAIHRGAACGFKAAEAFEIIRECIS